MDLDTTRSRAPSGLFSDEPSGTSQENGRSGTDAHPYRGTRSSLIARRHALEKELRAVESQIDLAPPEAPPPPPTASRDVAMTELASLLLPRRALGVVMAGVLAGVGISSMFAYRLGTTVPIHPRELHANVDAPRFAPRVRGESPEDHALRRRKDGEALLMSSFFSQQQRSGTTPRIVRLGRATWEVDASLLDQVEPPYVSLRMTPHITRGGRVDGVRILGIRPGSIHAQLGLQNGDVVLRANGFEMTGADAAVSAVESVDRTRQLILELLRDGMVIVQRYVVR